MPASGWKKRGGGRVADGLVLVGVRSVGGFLPLPLRASCFFSCAGGCRGLPSCPGRGATAPAPPERAATPPTLLKRAEEEYLPRQHAQSIREVVNPEALPANGL